VRDPESVLPSLKRCVLFAHLDEDALRALVAEMRRRTFRRNEVIFHAGDPAGSFHVVVSGAVKVSIPSAEGEEAIFATLGPGQFFGELALLDQEPRSATVTAVEPTVSLEMDRASFSAQLGDRGYRDALLVSLAGELRRLTDTVQALHFHDVPQRVAGRLLRLAGIPEERARGEAVVIDWPYTQSDLAAMVAATRQSVNRVLADFTERGLVEIAGGRLTIPDPGRLARELDR
jgi:CRP/FNR family cyclic AMP-dependent transcriptional regulator